MDSYYNNEKNKEADRAALNAQLQKEREMLLGPILGGAGAFGALIQNMAVNENKNIDTDIINRAIKISPYTDVDSNFKKKYINQSYLARFDNNNSSFHFNTEELFKKHIPANFTEYTPADLTLAGKYKEQLEQLPKTNFSTDVITVTPGPNPARFNSPEIDPEVLNADKARGYVWGNTEEPQFGYATGNYNREKVVTPNPSIYLANLDLSSTPKSNFHTTGQVLLDPSLSEKRVWGQRHDLDLFFPKETTRARGEVTAADLYTAIKNKGAMPDTGDVYGAVSDPGNVLRTLTKQYSELNKKPINESLLELASPVPALGDSTRERGAIPYLDKPDFSKATPEQLKKIGLTGKANSLFQLGEPSEGFSQSIKYSDFPSVNVSDNIFNPSKSIEPAAKSFGNISGKWAPFNSGAAVGGMLYTPEIIDSLEKGQYDKAAMQAGGGMLTGAMSDALVRGGVVQAAKAGLTAPARALAATGPLAAPLALVSQLGGSSRINKKFDEAAANAQMLRAEAARKRGGKWKFPTPFGQVTIPEFGLSESGGLFFR
jgi:hypothetical protein